ncbi:MAG TPA: hypothetical protein VFQ80_09785 [Thermomicrobiales bacterium]|nr:hypothetical protein [Thermomicrobiales bacterium]
MTTRSCYRIFDLPVSSELPLPLPLAEGEPAVEIVEGLVASRGAVVWRAAPPFDFVCRRDGAATILEWPEARFRVTASRVVVDARDRDAAALLLVPAVWAVVMTARGCESLHGCAVAHEGQGIAVLGASGAGKSTAGLTMRDRGWRVVTDDLIAFDAAGRAIPGPPFVRLRPDHGAARDGEPDVGGKFRLATRQCSEAVPLTAVIALHDDYVECAPLHGSAAVAALLDQVYAPMVTHDGQAQRRFELALDLVARTRVYGAPPRSLTAETIERIAQETAA